MFLIVKRKYCNSIFSFSSLSVASAADRSRGQCKVAAKTLKFKSISGARRFVVLQINRATSGRRRQIDAVTGQTLLVGADPQGQCIRVVSWNNGYICKLPKAYIQNTSIFFFSFQQHIFFLHSFRQLFVMNSIIYCNYFYHYHFKGKKRQQLVV